MFGSPSSIEEAASAILCRGIHHPSSSLPTSTMSLVGLKTWTGVKVGIQRTVESVASDSENSDDLPGYGDTISDGVHGVIFKVLDRCIFQPCGMEPRRVMLQGLLRWSQSHTYISSVQVLTAHKALLDVSDIPAGESCCIAVSTDAAATSSVIATRSIGSAEAGSNSK